jgi:hypothetical protein
VFHSATATWDILQSSNGVLRKQPAFGWPGVATPVPADYDGDGKADISVFHPATGGFPSDWYFIFSRTGAVVSLSQPTWRAGDVATPMDFDGDGRVDPVVYRPSTGQYIVSTWGGLNTTVTPGQAGDLPLGATYAFLRSRGASQLLPLPPVLGPTLHSTSAMGLASAPAAAAPTMTVTSSSAVAPKVTTSVPAQQPAASQRPSQVDPGQQQESAVPSARAAARLSLLNRARQVIASRRSIGGR